MIFLTSGIEKVDFGRKDETAKLINDFVDDSTNGLIKRIVNPTSINGATKLMLINAIYFSGKWKMPFETKPMNFKVDGKAVNNINGMHATADFNQVKMKLLNSDKEIGIIEMPYKDDDFSMYLIQPPEDIDIRDFNWAEIDFKNLDAKMKSEMTALQLPKFNITYKKNLNELFKRLGANDAFSSEGN